MSVDFSYHAIIHINHNDDLTCYSQRHQQIGNAKSYHIPNSDVVIDADGLSDEIDRLFHEANL